MYPISHAHTGSEHGTNLSVSILKWCQNTQNKVEAHRCHNFERFVHLKLTIDFSHTLHTHTMFTTGTAIDGFRLGFLQVGGGGQNKKSNTPGVPFAGATHKQYVLCSLSQCNQALTAAWERGLADWWPSQPATSWWSTGLFIELSQHPAKWSWVSRNYLKVMSKNNKLT